MSDVTKGKKLNQANKGNFFESGSGLLEAKQASEETFKISAASDALEESAGEKIVKKQGEIDERTLIINDINQPEMEEFNKGRRAIGQKLKKAMGEYEEEIKEIQAGEEKIILKNMRKNLEEIKNSDFLPMKKMELVSFLIDKLDRLISESNTNEKLELLKEEIKKVGDLLYAAKLEIEKGSKKATKEKIFQ